MSRIVHKIVFLRSLACGGVWFLWTATAGCDGSVGFQFLFMRNFRVLQQVEAAAVLVMDVSNKLLGPIENVCFR